MSERRKYAKKASAAVVAVQLDLETSGFTYRKWDAEQRCKQGDWLVDNEGDHYTVDREVFARTYRGTSKGLYVKTTPVWAEVARSAGSVPTKEGESHYDAGDYIVFNEEDGGDGYCMKPAKFEEMYEPAE